MVTPDAFRIGANDQILVRVFASDDFPLLTENERQTNVTRDEALNGYGAYLVSFMGNALIWRRPHRTPRSVQRGQVLRTDNVVNDDGYPRTVTTYPNDGSRIFVTLNLTLNSYRQPYRLTFTARRGNMIYQQVLERWEGYENPEFDQDAPPQIEGYLERARFGRGSDVSAIARAFCEQVEVGNDEEI